MKRNILKIAYFIDNINKGKEIIEKVFNKFKPYIYIAFNIEIYKKQNKIEDIKIPINNNPNKYPYILITINSTLDRRYNREKIINFHIDIRYKYKNKHNQIKKEKISLGYTSYFCHIENCHNCQLANKDIDLLNNTAINTCQKDNFKDVIRFLFYKIIENEANIITYNNKDKETILKYLTLFSVIPDKKYEKKKKEKNNKINNLKKLYKSEGYYINKLKNKEGFNNVYKRN